MAKKTDKKKSGKKDRRMSQEDSSLWRHVTKDVSPLSSNRFSQFKDLLVSEKKISGPASKRVKTRHMKQIQEIKPDPAFKTASGENQIFKEAVQPSVRKTVPGLDRNTSEKLRKGKLFIEGRVDLHGMTRREAHSRLKSFLGSAHRQGKRCVLVITGKGSSTQMTDDAPFMGGGRKGILKEEVPRWLREPDLRRLVLDYREAQVKHGGSGALYVLLKRSRR
ncbi:MAG: Smr/MutS family protein [Sneathiellales bacterium]|nr:Smr/MutS family protein [Sneathiellales bacterium]